MSAATILSLDGELAAAAAAGLARIRQANPRVHCITNAAATVFTANTLLALGAVPSMTIAASEVDDFVRGSDALLVNLGTMDAARREAIGAALDAASDTGKPWVLDPVFVHRSPERLAFARTLAASGPDVIRANADEIGALTGRPAGPGVAEEFARSTGAAVLMTGAVDAVSDGAHSLRLAVGHPLMARVTAMGCALGAVAAAFLAVGQAGFSAASSAALVFGVAGELAGKQARGPGTFPAALLDALYAMDETELARRVENRT